MFSDIGKPKVLLFQPCGLQAKPCDVDATWHRQDWHHNPKSAELVGRNEFRSGSLVGSFNEGWARARNMVERGQATHFAMLHADVWASAWWITDLIAEMRRYNALVASAHVGIKHHARTHTSTAVGPIDDPYSHTCLTMSDLAKLPETITPEHVCKDGEVLVINTGVMVIDLRHPWVMDWVWPQTCAIERNARGVWRSKLRTEDWEMSRFLHARGVRYIATRKVTTRHYGMDFWEVGPDPRPARVRDGRPDHDEEKGEE